MSDLLSDLEPELAVLRSSDDERERDAAAFITSLFSEIDKDNHDRGLHDFKGETLAWLGKVALRISNRIEAAAESGALAAMCVRQLRRLALASLTAADVSLAR